MNKKSILTTIVQGWKIIIKILHFFFKKFFKGLETLFELFCKKRKKEKATKVCCINPPKEIRPRPDPMIYSQQWLTSRGLAVTWNNPDFKLIEIATGSIADNWNLKPLTKYRIEVTVHNLSVMAAVNTTVDFEVRAFGIAGGILSGGSQDIINVPAIGSAVAQTRWETPAAIGHICLIAKIYHPDDANPLNNIGQHNTVVVGDEQRKNISFIIGNDTKHKKSYSLKLDTYQLPAEPMKAQNYSERQSLQYLRKLQSANSIKNFQVSDNWVVDITDEAGNRLNKNEIVIENGTAKKINMNIKSYPENAAVLNIQGQMDNNILVGGITIILTK